MTQWGLDTLFNPAKRHMDEEKRRLQATRQQVGDTSGGKRIDFESGKVRIGKARDEDVDDETAEASEGADDTADHTADDTAGQTAVTDVDDVEPEPKKELTPAQLRAAQRRGRQPR